MDGQIADEGAALTYGPVIPMLMRLTVPMIFGIVSLVVFQMADTYFIGRLGTRPLAAISYTFPVILVINSIALGIGLGASAVISRAIGEGNQDRVRVLTTHSLLLALLIVAGFVLAGLLTINPLFSLLGAGGDILVLIQQYMNIWYLGMIFVVVPMIGNNAIRATGDTLTPGLIMVIAAIANIILDPLLIFGIGPFPRMGISGAAVATVLGRSLTFVVALYILAVREKMIPCPASTVKQMLQSWGAILHIGIPTAISKMILPLGIGIITRLLSYYGPEAVAAYGVASRIEFFGMTVIIALAAVAAPFVGQNRGAQLFARIRKGVTGSELFSITWGVIFGITVFIFARPLALLFNDDPRYVEVLITYLRIVPLFYGLHGVMLITSNALNVLKRPFLAAFLAGEEMFVFCIPLAWFFSYLLGPAGVFTAISIAFVAAGVTGHFMIKKVINYEENSVKK
ncbi:MAG: MATE family efflux transporter [bacterium]